MHRSSTPQTRCEIQRTRQNKYPMKFVRLGLWSNFPLAFQIYLVRRTVTNSFDDIIAQLECAGDDLSDLVDYADNFVNWWNDMKIGLWSLQSSVSLIKLDKSNPLCQEVVRIRWEGFKERHVQYKRRVHTIRSCCFHFADIRLNRSLS